MFFKEKKPIEYLIAGLGNPGGEYELTHHNAGFLTLDILANRYSFETDRLKFHSLTCLTEINGHRCLIMRPQTYMNNSGTAVAEGAQFYKIPPEKCIIIFDDIDIPFGDVRIKRKGSPGTHNGVKSVTNCLGSQEFPRIKIGVGSKPDPDEDLADYVLSKFTKKEQDELKKTMEKACDAIEYIVDGKIDLAMERCQIFSKKKKKEENGQ